MALFSDRPQKKLILMGTTFLLAVGAYLLFTSADNTATPPPRQDSTEAVRKFVSRPPSTQPAVTPAIGDTGISFSPGDQTRVKIYDEVTGRLKYIFESKSWEPITETDFHLKELAIQIYMPRGEITYITADEAEVTLARKSGSRVDPKRGRVWGNVKVVIDRTTAKWREENPELADRYAHADDLINISLGEAQFDLDRAELRTEGEVLVDSSEARIEKCRGLTVQWDQLDNRIDLLRFEQGGKMILRRGGRMVDFAMPGTVRVARNEGKQSQEGAGVSGGMQAPKAMAMKPMSVGAVSAAEAAAEIREESGLVSTNQPKSIRITSAPVASGSAPSQQAPAPARSEEELAAAMGAMQAEARSAKSGELLNTAIDDALAKDRPRVQTYRAIFTNEVVVEQVDGLRTIGKIESDRLEVNFDFGKKQRKIAAEKPPQQAPAVVAGGGPEDNVVDLAQAPVEEDKTRLTLTWNGPLELRPIRADPAAQTGERFDAIANGAPVKIYSEQAGQGKAATASCEQLVYRHERRQVWMSGDESRPVKIHVDGSGGLSGREVFFDQQRGLGRVEGPGSMNDDRGEEAPDGEGSPIFAAASGLGGENRAAGRPRDPVDIRWSQGVDFELGARKVLVINPATGMEEEKHREFLQRAWFKGDVSILQGEDGLAGQQVAVTFGSPASGSDVADHISHLSMSGDVRLQRGDDLLSGDWLEVQMALTPEGRSVPRIVDAAGDVIAKQESREIRAGKMHVVMTTIPGEPRLAPDGKTMLPGKARLGMESVDALGNVLVRDPAQNLKISRAHSLKTQMRGGNELATALIVSEGQGRFARARFGDVALHGEQIEIDMLRQSIVVPGPGVSFMRTTEDFGGRKLREPTIVKTQWSDRMQLHLERNYGVFLGDILSSTDEFSLKSDKLTVRFAKAPPAAPRKKSGEISPVKLLADVRSEAGMLSTFASPGVVVGYTTVRLLHGLPQGKVFGKLAPALGREPKEGKIDYAVVQGDRKKPVYVVAEGNAEAITTEHAPRSGFQLRGRLLSRVRIAADQIAVDLNAQQMNIPCKGTLLIEDYQFDPRARQAQAMASKSSSPMMSSMRSEGPSQSAVTWQNSMDYFVDRNLVVFDRDVTMVHRSGRQMVLQGELAVSMGIDPDQLLQLDQGRIATLRCGNLLLEFKTPKEQKSQAAQSSTDSVRATDLQRLIARQAVHMRENSKSLTGEHLQYLADSGEIRVEGGPGFEATIMDEEERTGRFMTWRGPYLVWNRITGQIDAPRATIRTSQR